MSGSEGAREADKTADRKLVGMQDQGAVPVLCGEQPKRTQGSAEGQPC